MKKILAVLALTLVFLSSCGKSSSVDIINPDAEYLYFFGATCPHCQELNRRLDEAELLPLIPVEKREVYFNNENREMFLALVEEIQPERDGVPFVYDKLTGQVAVGVDPAFELLTSRLEGNTQEDDIEVIDMTQNDTQAEQETMTGETTESDTMTEEEIEAEETSNT